MNSLSFSFLVNSFEPMPQETRNECGDRQNTFVTCSLRSLARTFGSASVKKWRV